jgi:hypothetical protein
MPAQPACSVSSWCYEMYCTIRTPHRDGRTQSDTPGARVLNVADNSLRSAGGAQVQLTRRSGHRTAVSAAIRLTLTQERRQAGCNGWPIWRRPDSHLPQLTGNERAAWPSNDLGMLDRRGGPVSCVWHARAGGAVLDIAARIRAATREIGTWWRVRRPSWGGGLGTAEAASLCSCRLPHHWAETEAGVKKRPRCTTRLGAHERPNTQATAVEISLTRVELHNRVTVRATGRGADPPVQAFRVWQTGSPLQWAAPGAERTWSRHDVTADPAYLIFCNGLRTRDPWVQSGLDESQPRSTELPRTLCGPLPRTRSKRRCLASKLPIQMVRSGCEPPHPPELRRADTVAGISCGGRRRQVPESRHGCPDQRQGFAGSDLNAVRAVRDGSAVRGMVPAMLSSTLTLSAVVVNFQGLACGVLLRHCLDLVSSDPLTGSEASRSSTGVSRSKPSSGSAWRS